MTHRQRQADGVRRPVRRRPRRDDRGRQRRPRRPARPLPGARRREPATAGELAQRTGTDARYVDGVAARPGGRRLRRVRRGDRDRYSMTAGEGVRPHRPGRPAVPARRLRARPGCARGGAADGGGVPHRRRHRLARARRAGVPRLRAVLPPGLPRAPGGRVDPGARRRRRPSSSRAPGWPTSAAGTAPARC